MYDLTVPHHIHYLVLAPDLTILARSRGLDRFVEADATEVGQEIYEGFPELFGCEEVLEEILAGERESFNLQGITRSRDRDTNLYIDLYFQAYEKSEQTQNALILFVEDVTPKMALEQTLVQATNETKLLNSALTASRNYTNRIVTSIADALIVTDTHQIVKTINEATERLFGYEKKELIDRHLSLLVEDGDRIFAQLQKQIAHYGELNRNIEVTCRTRTEAKITVAFSCSLIQIGSENEARDLTLTPEIVYIGRDITERKRTQKRLSAQYAIANILSESSSLETDTQRILKAIGEILGWDVGELWRPVVEDENRTLAAGNFSAMPPLGREDLSPHSGLRRVALWTNPDATVSEFIQITETVVLQVGMGLAGRVWENGYPQWIADLSGDTDFGLDSAAMRSGLRSAFAFPIQSGNEMLGVMGFFGREKLPPDEHLLQMMAATGNQLGQFIKRKQAEAALREQQAKSESLLLNILPKPIADRLKEETNTIADSFDEVTVLFADLVGFTEMSAKLSPIEVVEQLNAIFSEFDRLTECYQLEKIKTIGDAYMVVGGLPEVREDHAEIVAEMALEMQVAIAKINVAKQQDFKIRVGINTGSVVAGVIGMKKFIYDLWGDTVNTASRMESHGKAGWIQVTETTYQRLRDRYAFTERGLIPIKGKGEMKTYWLTGKKSSKTLNQ
ncbi:MAG: PAS domain S-box protein [Cyanobacteria bacterium SBLK]|nr:PAS domain S-box protein [Cyanobacteria bacterium SBLK]